MVHAHNTSVARLTVLAAQRAEQQTGGAEGLSRFACD